LSEEGLSPGKVLVYRQGSTPPVMMNYGSVPSDFNIEEERLLSEFSRISGVSEVMKYGNIPDNITSGTAISLLIEQDDSRLSLTSSNIRNAVKEMGQQILRLYKQFALEKRLKRISGENGLVEMLYFNANDLSNDDLVFDAENDLADTITNRRTMAMQILQLGLLQDESGKISPRNKTKILEILGYGNWENSKDIEELNIKKAGRENLKFAQTELIPDKTDDHGIHIAEHVKYILSAEHDEDSITKQRVAEHIEKHKQLSSMLVALEVKE
jgi:hypothetical protein